VHDSVLQTLTLIQRNASDPIEVLRLARGSERELRGWLYTPRGDGPATLQAALLAAAADVEDEHGVQVDVVTVGDVPADERVGAVVQAAREAMVNAAKSSGAPTVSVFAEVTDGRVQVFVRDRGRGFDLAAVPADRYGVRESIVARMARNGGTAEIRTAPGSGTEVRLDLPPTAAVRP
jgi:signal transduction histidine kinase